MDKKWLQAALKERGHGAQAQLADYLGLSASVTNKLVKGPRRILADEASKIRAFLEIPPDEAPSQMREVRLADAEANFPSRSTTTEDIPVLGTVLGGATGGDFTMNGDESFRVRRPEKLAGRRDVFALFVQGESMVPRYFSGELIFCERAVPPQNGDFVVVEMRPGPDGTQDAYLKQLVATTPTKLRLKQFNPDRTLELDRKKVLQIVRVMPLKDLLGR